jgi:hypothetical protein
LKALADHGEISAIMSADGGDYDTALDQFATAGIDIYDLAAKLRDEGRNRLSVRGPISWV